MVPGKVLGIAEICRTNVDRAGLGQDEHILIDCYTVFLCTVITALAVGQDLVGRMRRTATATMISTPREHGSLGVQWVAGNTMGQHLSELRGSVYNTLISTLSMVTVTAETARLGGDVVVGLLVTRTFLAGGTRTSQG